MTKKLAKITSGLFAGASMLYWLVAPVVAVNILCPDATQLGINVPGCGTGGTIGVSAIISFIINILLFAAFVIALVFLIIGGIKWVMSGGDKEGANKAKETVTSALIGLAVVLGSWVLINLVISTLSKGASINNINIPSLTP